MPAAVFVIIELALRVVLLAMEGQTPEQRAKMWGWFIETVEWWRRFVHIDPPAPASARRQRAAHKRAA